MLPAEVIDRLRREREERDRSSSQIPLYPPNDYYSDHRIEDEEPTENSRVIVIEL